MQASEAFIAYLQPIYTVRSIRTYQLYGYTVRYTSISYSYRP